MSIFEHMKTTCPILTFFVYILILIFLLFLLLHFVRMIFTQIMSYRHKQKFQFDHCFIICHIPGPAWSGRRFLLSGCCAVSSVLCQFPLTGFLWLRSAVRSAYLLSEVFSHFLSVCTVNAMDIFRNAHCSSCNCHNCHSLHQRVSFPDSFHTFFDSLP